MIVLPIILGMPLLSLDDSVHKPTDYIFNSYTESDVI